MQRRLLCWLGAVTALAMVTAPESRGGELVVGADVGAALPISELRSTADPGGAIAPYVGYQFGDKVAFTPIIQPQFAAFNTEICCKRESDVTSIFSITGGGRLSLNDAKREVYVSAQGGYYTDITGPLNDEGEGFAVSGGFNYELSPGTALGLYIRRDQSAMRAKRGSPADLTFLTTGLSFRHRFLPPPPPPPPPPPAPVVAQAPPPPPPLKRKIVLRGVKFDFDQATIRDEAQPILDQAVQTLEDEVAIVIVVEGHTDAVGSEEYNQALSLHRAEAVRDYLAGKGIEADRMTVAGFGELQPVADNGTAEGRAQNRRVELRVKD